VLATAQTALSAAFTADLDAALGAVGIDVLTIIAEYGPAQLEVTVAPHWGVATADAAATLKGAVKEVAAAHGLAATSVTRPFPTAGGAACGGHLNLSLWAGWGAGDSAGGFNLLHDAAAPAGLSTLSRHLLAGLLAHGHGLSALLAPTVNCYTGRSGLDGWAPATSCWGVDNRSACVRVKPPPAPPPAPASVAANAGPPAAGDAAAAAAATPPLGGGTYIECRQPSAAASPHVALAAVVAAGADGLRRRLRHGLPPPVGGSVYDAVRGCGAAAVGGLLPADLPAALAALAADRRLTGALGEPFVRWFMAVKAAELHDWEGGGGGVTAAAGRRGGRGTTRSWRGGCMPRCCDPRRFSLLSGQLGHVHSHGWHRWSTHPSRLAQSRAPPPSGWAPPG